ncbi:dTDP-glucose 4,6-dehydratase [Candidatus Microgenomates bacterium]|nr:dTDP-glucose 4,6-dehydratase [Candidatus Microgenomates bacterium]
MKVLVTGGAGFIGSNFVLYWLKNHPDDHVINVDKLTYAGNLENLASAHDNPNHHFVRADIGDSAAMTKALEGVDTVVHFAAESHVDRSIMTPTLFLETNVVGTQVLLEAAYKNKVSRFHHISTDEVFGSLELNSDTKFNEHTPYNPHSPYAASKAGSDHIVRAYHDTYGLPITISNCSNNFGPYHFPEKLIPLAITNLIEGKKVPIYGDGLYVRDWLFVEDHCRAIDMILEKGVVGETYCIGSMTRDMPNREIIRDICRIMEKNYDESVEQVKDRPGHDRRYAIDFSKIKNELGWEPKFDFSTALKYTIDWYTNNQDWWKHVKSGEYQKYYQQQYAS